MTTAEFQRLVKAFAKRHTRDLPWRKTTNPYRIMVSEVMLQQTQVDRVVPYYRAWLKKFPTVSVLAAAPLKDVLTTWSGLGYNRRAKFLHDAAKLIVTQYDGRMPLSVTQLEALPGIGPYTARAIVTFAYNNSEAFIETNIRTVYLHHFFPKKKKVPDAKLLPIIEQTLDKKNPRAWYAALMDYGTHLKQTIGNQNARSKQYAKQSRFDGSLRQVRGAIIAYLTKQPATVKQMEQLLRFDTKRIEEALTSLMRDGMIIKTKTRYSIA